MISFSSDGWAVGSGESLQEGGVIVTRPFPAIYGAAVLLQGSFGVPVKA